MKVLIVSHNVISNSQSMGKTLKAYFSDFHDDEVFQFYIHSQIPSDVTICKNYYRFTDIDAIQSIFRVKLRGKIYKDIDINEKQNSIYEKIAKGNTIYHQGSTASPIKHLIRDLVWKMGHWFTKDLKAWLDDVSPDVIFFASGNYCFIYDIALKMADYLNVPLIMSCYDDYYIYDENEGKFLSGFVHKRLLKKAKIVFNKSIFATTVCEKMAITYEKMFNVPCKTLYTGVKNKNTDINFLGTSICYFGNLSLNRHKQLISMGRALLSLNRETEPKMIDVYSAEKRQEIIEQLCPENGIRFHGLISTDNIPNIMKNSLAVIHTESFDDNLQSRVRFSVSTKIAESLANGPCLIAYGPRGIASIDYLADNNVAYIIDSKDNLEIGLKEIIDNNQIREKMIMNARVLAFENHNLIKNAKQFRNWIENYLQNRDE